MCEEAVVPKHNQVKTCGLFEVGENKGEAKRGVEVGPKHEEKSEGNEEKTEEEQKERRRTSSIVLPVSLPLFPILPLSS